MAGTPISIELDTGEAVTIGDDHPCYQTIRAQPGVGIRAGRGGGVQDGEYELRKTINGQCRLYKRVGGAWRDASLADITDPATRALVGMEPVEYDPSMRYPAFDGDGSAIPEGSMTMMRAQEYGDATFDAETQTIHIRRK